MSPRDAPMDRFAEHAARAAALGELHARPAPTVDGEARVLRLVFAFDPDYAGRDDALIAALCAESGASPPQAGARAARFAAGALEARWERHSEFVTYTFLARDPAGDAQAPAAVARLRAAQPGPLVAALRCRVRRDASPPAGQGGCASRVAGGRAVLATSFRADPEGFVDFDLACGGLSPEETGALVQWTLEIETYRTLALLALPIARRVGAMVRDSETLLGGLTQRLAAQDLTAGAESLYAELMHLAARIEAEIASSTYRFAAAQAYGAIVEDRLARLEEKPVDGRPMVGVFLSTRLTPALRTCASMHAALQDLARRCGRAADLIRTRIDLQLARQANEQLDALNERTRLQMRLQQTVEGLSVAAVSYYVLGLAGYFVKGAKDAGLLPWEPGVVVAALAAPVIVAVALAVRRIRRRHGGH
ncbi:MAG TPA: DUF3422 domain-containing protein [Beijerinckiaceae bacterium]